MGALTVAIGAYDLTTSDLFEEPFGTAASYEIGDFGAFLSNVIEVHHVGRVGSSTVGARTILQRRDEPDMSVDPRASAGSDLGVVLAAVSVVGVPRSPTLASARLAPRLPSCPR